MGMRVGIEEILSFKHFWSKLGEDWKKMFWKTNETVGFFEENESFRALKDKGIRILKKGIRISY